MTRTRSRSRILFSDIVREQYQWGPPGFETTPVETPKDWGIFELCTDEVHKEWLANISSPTSRDIVNIGGPFLKKHVGVTNMTPSEYVSLRDGYRRMDGRIFPKMGSSAILPNSWQSSYDALEKNYDSWGPTAWNRFKPGQPGVNLGQTLAELREAPHLAFRRLKRFRDYGSNYLAVEFGWKPFLKDLRSLYVTYKTLETRLEQLKRDNGRPIRRRGRLKTSHQVIASTDYGPSASWSYPVLTTFFYAGEFPRLKLTQTEDEDVWFSARFRYWIPDIGTIAWRRRAIRHIFGLDLTPSLAWELIPWSWLVDWFTNLGDVLSNVSENAAESLTADYSYLMAKQTKKWEYLVTCTYQKWPTGLISTTCSGTYELGWKRRIRATPFGFDLQMEDLSLRQQAILAALGLTLT